MPPTTNTPPPPTPAPKTFLSIPVPGMLIPNLAPIVQRAGVPFRAYDRVQTRRPYLTQFISSCIIYFLGDLSAQTLQRNTPQAPSEPPPPSGGSTISESPPQPPKPPYDPVRALRSVAVGAIFSIPSYRWFLFVSSRFNVAGRPWLSVAYKCTIQQFVFAPFFNSYFFGMHALLAGDGFLGACERVRITLPVSWVNSCKFWPVVTAGIFAFVKPQHRSVAAGLFAIGWQTYLGILNQRAAVLMLKEGQAAGEVGSNGAAA